MLCLALACDRCIAGNVPLAAVKEQPVVARQGLIVLRSDKPLTPEQIKWVAGTAERAYQFDLKQLGWDPADPAFTRPFDVVVISRAMLAERGWTIGGATYSGDVFAMNGRCLEDQAPYYTGVIAHELTHLLVNRKCGKTDLRELGWYPIMGEGIAIENGMRFRVLNEPDLYPDHRIPAHKALEEMTADAAKKNFTDAGTQRAHGDSDMGLLFIEFLRAHPADKSPDKSAVEDVQQRLGRVLTSMSQNGAHFDAAFKEQFGIALEKAQDQFVQHMRQTAGDPTVRLAGTILIPRSEYHRAK